MKLWHYKIRGALALTRHATPRPFGYRTAVDNSLLVGELLTRAMPDLEAL